LLKRNSSRQMIQLSTEKPNLDETKVGNGAPKGKPKRNQAKIRLLCFREPINKQSTNKKQEQKHH